YNPNISTRPTTLVIWGVLEKAPPVKPMGVREEETKCIKKRQSQSESRQGPLYCREEWAYKQVAGLDSVPKMACFSEKVPQCCVLLVPSEYPTVSREIYPVNPPAYHSSGLSPLFAFPVRATNCAMPRPRPAGMRRGTRILLWQLTRSFINYRFLSI
ncbi:hypothetical protein STEG23_032989, partial [Scotinomys teguina]